MASGFVTGTKCSSTSPECATIPASRAQTFHRSSMKHRAMTLRTDDARQTGGRYQNAGQCST